MEELATAINQYGFPIIAAMGLGYFVYYVWKWVTDEIKPVLGQANTTLIALIDRIRMLDNDMIRLNTKLNMLLEQQEKNKKK
jgi:hypothetical protein|tara:strand:- start:327 stop:572 length:246 start_codon:yes stop_codon:yes gene_type:complete